MMIKGVYSNILFSFTKENQKTFLENYVFLNILYKS